VDAIIKEATTNSQLEKTGHELMDGVGPRLVGSPQMQQAHDWAVEKYKSWGIPARNEKWGEWRGWERGITHIDMVSPWTKSLAGTQLAWSPNTKGKTVTGDVVIIPDRCRFTGFPEMVAECERKVCNDLHESADRPY
jgi:carboxypeptidase Q